MNHLNSYRVVPPIKYIKCWFISIPLTKDTLHGGFLKWGYLQFSSMLDWDFPWNKPSRHWGSTMENPTYIYHETYWIDQPNRGHQKILNTRPETVCCRMFPHHWDPRTRVFWQDSGPCHLKGSQATRIVRIHSTSAMGFWNSWPRPPGGQLWGLQSHGVFHSFP